MLRDPGLTSAVLSSLDHIQGFHVVAWILQFKHSEQKKGFDVVINYIVTTLTFLHAFIYPVFSIPQTSWETEMEN